MDLSGDGSETSPVSQLARLMGAARSRWPHWDMQKLVPNDFRLYSGDVFAVCDIIEEGGSRSVVAAGAVIAIENGLQRRYGIIAAVDA